MKNKIVLVMSLYWVGLFFNFQRAIAGSGNSSGGGSYSVTDENHQYKMLLDFYVSFNRRPDQKPGVPLKQTKAFNKLHIEKLQNSQHPAMTEALRRLAIWAPYSRDLVGEILKELTDQHFYYVSYRFNFKAEDPFIPKGVTVDPEKLSLIAFYTDELGVLFSQPEFDALDFNSQVGAIIHEALRGVQRYRSLSDEALQNVTDTLVLAAPTVGFNLEEDFKIPPLSIDVGSARLAQKVNLISQAFKKYEHAVSAATFQDAKRHWEFLLWISDPTPDTYRKASKSFLQFSRELVQYRIDNYENLDSSEHLEFQNSADTFHNFSDDFTAHAVGMAISKVLKGGREIYWRNVNNCIDEANGELKDLSVQLDRGQVIENFKRFQSLGWLKKEDI